MKETKCYCDKCKKEVETEDLTTVHAHLKCESVSSYKEYCEECICKLGFMKKTVKEGKKIIEPTTAEKLYELVAQIALEQMP